MVLSFEESCRVQIEQEYGSIVEFKRDVHKAMSVFNQEQIKQVLKAIYEAARKCAEEIIDCDKEIERLQNDKEHLISEFITKAEGINSQIKYLRELKNKEENDDDKKRI